MLWPASRLLRSFMFVTLLAPPTAAIAQEPEWFEVGTVVVEVDGVEQVKYAYDLYVPDGDDTMYAPGATFSYMEEVRMGDMLLLPAYFHVTVLAYDVESEDEQHSVIELNILVDAATLELTMVEDLRIVYYPNGPDTSNWYQLTEGGVVLDPVIVLDDDTWSLSGTISGYVSRHLDYDVAHNPDDMFRFEGRFDLSKVVRQD